jgi:quercetin dioxygenase-like cupin family protein
MPSLLAEFPVHLGLGATVESEPKFTGEDWYDDYVTRHEADGSEGRLVSMFAFDRPWDMWEMHPNGQELVVCVDGQMTLIQQIDGNEVSTTLGKGEYAINPAGVWHTADVAGSATALFITAGLGTSHRPR